MVSDREAFHGPALAHISIGESVRFHRMMATRASAGESSTGINGRDRLDFMPWLQLDAPVELGQYVAVPFRASARQLFPRSETRRNAERLLKVFRRADGRPVEDAVVIVRAGPKPLSEELRAGDQVRFARAVEAFRYLVLVRPGLGVAYGPNTSHLRLESFTFPQRRGQRFELTIQSRYGRHMGVTKPEVRLPLHLAPATVSAAQLDSDLRADLASQVTDLRGKARARLFRALWWHNLAHRDDRDEPSEYALLCLASAFEALVRPSDKVKGLQAAVQGATGCSDFDVWVDGFYKARSAISHGDLAWQPLHGPYRHVSHYEVASEVFRLLVRDFLARLTSRASPADSLLRSLRSSSASRLLSSDREVIDRFLPHDFHSLRLRRNARVAWEVAYIPVLLATADRTTRTEDYQRLLDWLRLIALSACRSAAARFPGDAMRYVELRRAFQVGIPPLWEASFVPIGKGVSIEKVLAAQASQPERRGVLGGTSLTDIAEAMREAESRRDLARYR